MSASCNRLRPAQNSGAIRDYDSAKGPLDRYVALRCRGAMIDGLRKRMLSTRPQRANGVEEPVVLSLQHELTDDLRLDELLADPYATTAEGVIERVDTAPVSSELRRLPHHYRRIMFGRFIETRSQQELAADEGLSRKTVAQWELRARQRLHRFRQAPDQPLTAKELTVLRLEAEGATSAETAKRLRKAGETVKSQRRAIIAKLCARNIIHALSIGYQRGLLH
jgi:RNA polymerase sigma factor (sigma-70 family)